MNKTVIIVAMVAASAVISLNAVELGLIALTGTGVLTFFLGLLDL